MMSKENAGKMGIKKRKVASHKSQENHSLGGKIYKDATAIVLLMKEKQDIHQPSRQNFKTINEEGTHCEGERMIRIVINKN